MQFSAITLRFLRLSKKCTFPHSKQYWILYSSVYTVRGSCEINMWSYMTIHPEVTAWHLRVARCFPVGKLCKTALPARVSTNKFCASCSWVCFQPFSLCRDWEWGERPNDYCKASDFIYICWVGKKNVPTKTEKTWIVTELRYFFSVLRDLLRNFFGSVSSKLK